MITLNSNFLLGYREELYSRLEIKRILGDHDKPKRPKLKQKLPCMKQVKQIEPRCVNFQTVLFIVINCVKLTHIPTMKLYSRYISLTEHHKPSSQTTDETRSQAQAIRFPKHGRKN